MLGESNGNSSNLQEFESYVSERMKIHKKPRNSLKAINLSQIETLTEPETIHGDNWKRTDDKVDKAQVMQNNNYVRNV